jgi:hypothetical protein
LAFVAVTWGEVELMSFTKAAITVAVLV